MRSLARSLRLSRSPALPRHLCIRSFSSEQRSGHVLDYLQERGFVAQTTNDEALREHLQTPRAVYAGFDPTADSLHLGNLLILVALKHFQDFGHKPVCLIGGTTGLVGDPSGRDTERPMIDEALVRHNCDMIGGSVGRFLRVDESSSSASVVNNAEWYSGMGMVHYLRDIGRHFRMSSMLNKDSVTTRLGSTEGMSYTEFSYQTLQAYDFKHLLQEHDCSLQLGGSDQYGNITAGVEYIRRSTSRSAYGLTVPLLTTASGAKFGKSAGNAVWLAKDKTSPFKFYQYFHQTADADLQKLFKLFTTRPLEEIEALLQEHDSAPGKRMAQERLAEDATRLVHGQGGVVAAQQASKVLFGGGSLTGLSREDIVSIFEGVPQVQIARDKAVGADLAQFGVECKAAKSKGELKRLIKGGGVYLNNHRISEPNYKLQSTDFVDDNVCVLRVGKRNQYVVLLNDQAVQR